MKISRNTVATISYTVTDLDGRVLGRTDPKEPVEALIGHGYLVKGLEKALDGHEKGDELAITLNPAEAYGEIDDSLVQTIDKSLFGDFELQIGNVFEADSNNGPMAVVVKEIHDDKVVVDGNHPLAGKVLNFLVVVEDVRAATESEKAHGHVHKGGQCPGDKDHGHHCCHHHHDEDPGDGHGCCHHHHHHDEEPGDGHGCCHHHRHDEEPGGGHGCCHHHRHDEEPVDGHGADRYHEERH